MGLFATSFISLRHHFIKQRVAAKNDKCLAELASNEVVIYYRVEMTVTVLNVHATILPVDV